MMAISPRTFRVRGDVIESSLLRRDGLSLELFGDEIEGLSQIDPLFGTIRQKYARLPIYPKSHYVVQPSASARHGLHPR